jgi:hypothetical protein
MASAANLAWLRESGRRYIIGAPKSDPTSILRPLSSGLSPQNAVFFDFPSILWC